MEFATGLKELGWDSFFEGNFEEFEQTALTPARVVEEFRGFYRVRSTNAEHLAEISGKLQHQAGPAADARV